MVVISHRPSLYCLCLRITREPSSFILVNIESTISRGLPRSCLPLFPCHALVDDILRRRRPTIGILRLAAKAPYFIVN